MLLYKAFKKPRRAISVLLGLLVGILGHKSYVKFIVLTRSRTGSNLLLSYLNSHPEVKAEGEIFRRLGGGSYKSILKLVFSKQRRKIKAKGFKIFYYHPLDESCPQLWKALAADNSIKVIDLQRENLLSVVVSRKIADKEDVWSTKRNKEEKTPRINFELNELKYLFEETERQREEKLALFSQHQVHEMIYERLVSDTASEFMKVCSFLDVFPINPATDLKKQNNKNLKDVIGNYEELKKHFYGTKWEVYFE